MGSKVQMIALDNLSLELLKKIQQQRIPTLFAPEKGDLAGFQAKAERLVFLADVCFIELAFPPSYDSKTGGRYIDGIAVRNITPRGARAIAEVAAAP